MIKLEAALAARARSGAAARRARRALWSRTPSGCASGCGLPMPSTSGCIDGGRAGGGSRRRTASRRRARCSTGWAGKIHRPRAAGLEPLARRASPTRHGARWRRLPAALDAAGVSAQGRRFHRARRREGPGARRGAARGRGGLDCGGISARRLCTCDHRAILRSAMVTRNVNNASRYCFVRNSTLREQALAAIAGKRDKGVLPCLTDPLPRPFSPELRFMRPGDVALARRAASDVRNEL